MPSIGAAKHAVKVASWGADAVMVQGGEGGGHTGPVPTTLLLPTVLTPCATPGATSRSSRPAGSSTVAAWRPPCRTAPPGSGWAPGSC